MSSQSLGRSKITLQTSRCSGFQRGEWGGVKGLSDSSAPFAKLIEDVNGALSVQEVGPIMVDGQQVTEFTASLTMVTLLPGKRLERFIKAFSSLGEILSPDKDILALEVPVDVHAPPARETISEAQLRKLRARRVCGIVPVHAASHTQPVICPRRSTRRR
jgi:hypothetical protein